MHYFLTVLSTQTSRCFTMMWLLQLEPWDVWCRHSHLRKPQMWFCLIFTNRFPLRSGKVEHTRKETGVNRQQCHALENKTRGLCCWSTQEQNSHQREREGKSLCAQGVNCRYNVPNKNRRHNPKYFTRTHTRFQFSDLFHSVTKFIWLYLFLF